MILINNAPEVAESLEYPPNRGLYLKSMVV